ncbi:MAG TPA: sigma-70 family RNA polymerase sigma factor [Terriglobia bacterium]|nr:sigma-70 family RNA polymerase sigma factor [Terriglobia bacterium]
MKAAQAGDSDAYVQLMREITPRICNVVRSRRRFLSIDDVEDLVQDVLLSVHAVRATYDPERPFMPWLIAITRNRLADAARLYARHGAKEVYVENLAVTFCDESAKFNTDEFGDREALKVAIEGLPAQQRNAIEMLKLREMSLKEAAAVSGTGVGALKVATHRAMNALRKALTKKKP